MHVSVSHNPPQISDEQLFGLVRDLVRDGENGFVVSAEEIDKACASLLVRLLDERVRKARGAAARRTAQDHAWDRVADAVEAVYRARLDRAPA